MPEHINLDGKKLVGIENDDGAVSADTVFQFEQTGERIYAHNCGGQIADGHLVGTFDEQEWNIRYVQITTDGETATGHSVGTAEILPDG
ncbi:hypothetical protein [Natrialba chahannaoensis]|uniref:hypothetical protein n=1 Tax=Natrialba chahannaoensis TaxID=68911 RepID=UPI001F4CAB62|nr:hypothetical protein [Natrialba chahannaoensis]